MTDRKFSQYDDWPDAVLLVDRAGSIAFANGRAEQLFGYEAGALCGESVDLLVPEQIRSGHPALRAKFFSNPRILTMGAGGKIHGLRSDGREIPIEIALGPAAEGPYALAAIRDISDIVQTRVELQKSEERLR